MQFKLVAYLSLFVITYSSGVSQPDCITDLVVWHESKTAGTEGVARVMQAGNNDDLKGLIGKSLGQFRIVERIGAGGMATVFKAYQPTLAPGDN